MLNSQDSQNLVFVDETEMDSVNTTTSRYVKPYDNVQWFFQKTKIAN